MLQTNCNGSHKSSISLHSPMFSKCFHFRNNTDVELAFGKRKKKGEKEEKKERKNGTGVRLGNRWARVAGETLNNRLHPWGSSTRRVRLSSSAKRKRRYLFAEPNCFARPLSPSPFPFLRLSLRRKYLSDFFPLSFFFFASPFFPPFVRLEIGELFENFFSFLFFSFLERKLRVLLMIKEIRIQVVP